MYYVPDTELNALQMLLKTQDPGDQPHPYHIKWESKRWVRTGKVGTMTRQRGNGCHVGKHIEAHCKSSHAQTWDRGSQLLALLLRLLCAIHGFWPMRGAPRHISPAPVILLLHQQCFPWPYPWAGGGSCSGLLTHHLRLSIGISLKLPSDPNV